VIGEWSTAPAALVTGASRGIGRGIAAELAAAGFSVAVNYRSNAEAAEETCRICRQRAAERYMSAEGAAEGSAAGKRPGKSRAGGDGSGEKGPRFVPVQGDVAGRRDREELVERSLREFGRLDALVNNAGISPKERRDITEASEESFEELMRTNLQGPYFLTQRVVRYWLTERPECPIPGGQKIVFVGSISADTVSLNRGEYCVSKAGMAMASQLWAVRLAAEGIQVYEVRPGIIRTDMTGGVVDKYDPLIRQGMVPQRRWGQPEDLGRSVRSLLEGDHAFAAGSVIQVDGGFHIKVL
jgi:NAD(P)-dependent dehydrogenase (short-subunit alcohol dehydrogenase family)